MSPAGPHRKAAPGPVAALLAAALLASCTAGRPGSAGPATGSGTATAPATSPAPPADEAARQPLVLATHATRPPLRLTTAQAGDVVAGRVGDWAALGQRAGPLRLLVGTEPGSARRTVAALARDREALAVLPAAAVDPRVRPARVAGVHPLRAPTAYPLTVPGPRPPAPVTVSIVGDLMLGRGVGAAAAASGDVAAPLRPTAARLAHADLTVGNLESTLSRAGSPTQGDDSFAADPAVLDGLTDAGFDVLGLANNHVGDFGPRALVSTVRRVERAGVVPVGAGADAEEARRPAVVERAGLRFGVLAFNAIGETPRAQGDRPGAVALRMPPRTGPLQRGDLAALTGAVTRLAARVDVVLVLPHWGTQYTHDPVRAQHVVARALVAAGADLVVGSHPHWVQGLAWVDGALVAHSLGNFVFDMVPRETRQGVVLEAVLWGDEVKGVELAPVRIGADFAPRVVAGAAARNVLAGVWVTGRGPFRLR